MGTLADLAVVHDDEAGRTPRSTRRWRAAARRRDDDPSSPTTRTWGAPTAGRADASPSTPQTATCSTRALRLGRRDRRRLRPLPRPRRPRPGTSPTGRRRRPPTACAAGRAASGEPRRGHGGTPRRRSGCGRRARPRWHRQGLRRRPRRRGAPRTRHQHGLVNVGGDLYALGTPRTAIPGGSASARPGPRARCGPTLDVRDEAVATSGDYERFFRHAAALPPPPRSAHRRAAHGGCAQRLRERGHLPRGRRSRHGRASFGLAADAARALARVAPTWLDRSTA